MRGGIPMSVRRLIADVDLESLCVTEFCVTHGISRWSFYSIRKRFEVEGEAGLELRSRAPRRVANKTPADVEDEIVSWRKELEGKGLDAGPATIRWHFEQHWDRVCVVPSEATIWRILKARGFIVADPSKAPCKQWKSFAAERANEVWQIDGTDHELVSGQIVKIINIVDDGSRLNVGAQTHLTESFDAVWSTACSGAETVGWPERFLSDNGKANVKLQGPLAELGIAMGHSKPYHPQTCGKVERFHQTQTKWLAKQPPAPDLEALQDLLDEFRHIYNHERPHRAIGRKTPATVWASMPKSGPAASPLQTPATIAHTKVATNGIINTGSYQISVGKIHAGKTATTLITESQAHIFANGELIRRLTIDPNKRTQPYKRHPTPRTPK